VSVSNLNFLASRMSDLIEG